MASTQLARCYDVTLAELDLTFGRKKRRALMGSLAPFASDLIRGSSCSREATSHRSSVHICSASAVWNQKQSSQMDTTVCSRLAAGAMRPGV